MGCYSWIDYFASLLRTEFFFYAQIKVGKKYSTKVYINAKFLELLPRRQVYHMLIDASLALQQLLIQKVESHRGFGLCVHRHPELIGMSGRYPHMTCINIKNGIINRTLTTT